MTDHDALMARMKKFVDETDEAINGSDGPVAQIRETVKGLTERMDKNDAKKVDVDKLATEVGELREQYRAFGKRIANADPSGANGADPSKFSLVRAMAANRSGDWDKAPYEREVLDAADGTNSVYGRTQNISSDKMGGFFVPDAVIGTVIEAVYKKSHFVALDGDGSTRISVYEGLSSPHQSVPVFKGGAQAQWLGERDEREETESEVGRINMGAKKLGAILPMTKETLMFTSFGFEGRVRRDLVKALATKLDWTVLYGTGTTSMPRGLLYHPEIRVFSTENFNRYRVNPDTPLAYHWDNADLARAGKPNWGAAAADIRFHDLTFDVLSAMRGVLEDNDIEVDGGSSAFAFSPKVARRMKQLKVDQYANQTENRAYLLGLPIIPDSRLRESIGEFVASTKIKNNHVAGQVIRANAANAGTGKQFSEAVFGDWSDLFMGRWGGLEIEDDGGVGLGFSRDITYVKAGLFADMQVADPRSFIFTPDIYAGVES